MSEYEETDSLTLAVAKAMYEAERKHHQSEATWEALVRMNGRNGYKNAKQWYIRTIEMSEAAIKAYEAWHQGPALTAEEVAKVTQAVHDTIGSPAVIAKVEDGNVLLQALTNRDLP